jgi:hypothetical protein
MYRSQAVGLLVIMGSISHSNQNCWLGFKIQAVQIKFLKLFLASNSSYLTYFFWHLGDIGYSICHSFMAVDTGEI